MTVIAVTTSNGNCLLNLLASEPVKISFQPVARRFTTAMQRESVLLIDKVYQPCMKGEKKGRPGLFSY